MHITKIFERQNLREFSDYYGSVVSFTRLQTPIFNPDRVVRNVDGDITILRLDVRIDEIVAFYKYDKRPTARDNDKEITFYIAAADGLKEVSKKEAAKHYFRTIQQLNTEREEEFQEALAEYYRKQLTDENTSG